MHDSPPIDWRAVLGEHQRWMRRVIASRLDDADAVDDVLQEVALAVIQNPSRPTDPEKIGPWLFRVTVCQAFNFLRRKRRQRKLHDGLRREPPAERYTEPDPIVWVLCTERRATVQAALALLSQEDQELLRLKYLEGLRYRELAERLGINLERVEYRLLRARQRLREQLQQEEEP
jgi:RNA polymerase sigma-70 factor (ECF subfamily)